MKLDSDRKEIEPLRLKLMEWYRITQESLNRDGNHHLTTNLSFYRYLRRGYGFNKILSTPFNELPLIVNKPVRGINPEWHQAIIEWRLQIGK